MLNPLNAFLRGLPPESRARLSPSLSTVRLALGQTLSRPDDGVEHVYFPESALLSLLIHGRGGEAIETAMVGVEGAFHLLEACGSGRSSATCAVQGDGEVLRAPAALCRTMMLTDPGFATCALKLFELQLAETRQSGLCQGRHTVEPRLARWLLESSERANGRNPLPLTQEFISAMLGVQRTTVNASAVQLQNDGLIRYGRGRIELVDVRGLERRACDCRHAMQMQRERLALSTHVRMTGRLDA